MNSKVCQILTFLFLLALSTLGLSAAQDGSPYASPDNAYTILADLPVAVVQDLTVSDTLPQGLIYRRDSLEVSGAEYSPSETISFPNDGSQPVTITWSFGQVDNSAGQDVLIRFQSIVADVATNQDGEILGANLASLQYVDDSGILHTASGETASLKLVEPDLEITMESSSANERTVTYTASVGHTLESHANAFDSDLSILLPAGITYSPGSAEVVSAPPGALDDTNPQELKIHFDGIDRSWNKDNMILLKFQASTEDGAAPGASSGEIKAALTWKSAPEENPGTRSYIKSQSIPIPEYVPSYSLSINSVAEPDPVEAGQSLLYTISYANTGKDDVHGVTIKETYDQNVTYLSAIPMADADRENLWTIGDLLAGGSGTIKLVVRINPDSADGTMLKNSVKMSCGEYATAEAITETKVIGKSEKLTTKASSNSTNSSQIENKTASQDILQNNTENATAAIVSINDTKNDTKSDLMYINQDNATETTNTTTLKSDLAMNQSDALVNLTAEAEDPMTEEVNLSETGGDLPEEAATQLNESSETQDEVKALEQVEQNVENDVEAKADLVSLNQDTVAELTDTISKSHLSINQIDALSNPIAETEDSMAGAGSQSETGGDLSADAASQNEIADKSSEILDEAKAFEQLELNVKNDIYTISFGDGINVDIVFDKSNPMMEKTYVVLNDTGVGSNGDEFNSIDQKGAAPSNTTSNSELVTNQTDVEINKTEEIKILQGNESEKGIDLSIVSDNETDIQADPAVAVEGASDEPEKILLQVDSADPAVAVDGTSDEPEKSPIPVDSGSDQAINRPADEENLPVESANQYPLESVELPLEPPINETGVANAPN